MISIDWITLFTMATLGAVVGVVSYFGYRFSYLTWGDDIDHENLYLLEPKLAPPSPWIIAGRWAAVGALAMPLYLYFS